MHSTLDDRALLCVSKTSSGDDFGFTDDAVCIAPDVAPLNHY
jgi:hypothetical protein